MEQHLKKIFGAQTVAEVCEALQNSLNALKKIGYLAKLPDYYEDIAAGNQQEVQDWFDEMKEDSQSEKEGVLKEVYGLFDAARSRLRELGFHRQPD
ncbi:MAG: hypothetical protein MN733_30465 [Nitrososphaera sp.]|nr:hypothetical protein [Nitrososphaera sp.]